MRKHRWLLLLLALAAPLMQAQNQVVIAHRGASGYLPEHTLAAKAMAHAQGADFLEQDVVLTRDGVPIVLHDVHLETTTDVALVFPGRARKDGHYYAIDFSLAEIKQLRANERVGKDGKPVFSGRYPAGPRLFEVPTLAEEIALVQGLNTSTGRTAGIYPELKAPQWHIEQGLDPVPAVLAVLRDAGLERTPELVFLQCFDDRTLLRLKQEYQVPYPLIQLIGENSWREDGAVDYDAMQTAEGMARVATYASGIGPWIGQLYRGADQDAAPLLALARQHGLLVHPYTFRTEQLPPDLESFEQLLSVFLDDFAVDGIFTDFPDLARAYLDRSEKTVE
ncbi:MAG: glycerophosphodiester phosphodiesterase [Pseudomonadota bacterium]